MTTATPDSTDSRPRPTALLIPTRPEASTTVICGLTVLSRLICSLDRAATGVRILAPAGFPEAILDHARRDAAGHPKPAPSRIVNDLRELPTAGGWIVAPEPIVLDHRILDPILEAPNRADHIVAVRRPAEQRVSLWYVGPAVAAKLQAEITAPTDAPASITGYLEAQPCTQLDPGPELCDVVSGAPEVGAITEKLFTLARKASDSWMAKSFDRRISLWVTRRLIHRPISPNQITIGATAVGLLGGLLLALGTYWAQLVGSLLLTFSIIVDGCDGEVARIKYMESDFGRRLDFFLDNVVNTLSIFTVGAGHYWAGGPSFYLWASAINATVAAASVLPVYWLFFQRNKESVKLSPTQPTAAPAKTFLDRLEDMSGRDFAYLILGLSLFGRAYWFAGVALIGLTGFFLIVAGVAASKFVGAANTASRG